MNLFDKLLMSEKEFSSQEFLAPVLRGQKIKIKLNNVVMDLRVNPAEFQGWGIFKTNDFKTALRIREADTFERGAYLDLFPAIRAVVVKSGDDFYGLPLPDARFKITGMIPIQLPEELEQFEVVRLSYDGNNFWFDHILGEYTFQSDYMRTCFSNNVLTKDLHYNGLLKEHADAYDFAKNEIKRLTEQSFDGRIQAAVRRGGGLYKSHKQITKNQFTVTYDINGQSFTSTVNNKLNVESAGICLSGTDRQFDLQSLMGVLLEGQRRSLIYRTR